MHEFLVTIAHPTRDVQHYPGGWGGVIIEVVIDISGVDGCNPLSARQVLGGM